MSAQVAVALSECTFHVIGNQQHPYDILHEQCAILDFVSQAFQEKNGTIVELHDPAQWGLQLILEHVDDRMKLAMKILEQDGK